MDINSLTLWLTVSFIALCLTSDEILQRCVLPFNCQNMSSPSFVCNCFRDKFCSHLLCDCSIKELHLNNCGLHELLNNSFVNLTNLRTLNISQNKFDTIDSDAFYGLQKLEKLEMQQAIIGVPVIPDDVFRPLVRLEYLDMSHNCIWDIKKFFTSVMCNVFSDLQTLKLNSVFCPDRIPFPSLTAKMLACLQNLTYLSMEGNHISHIKAESVHNVPNLKYLSLRNNIIAPDVRPLWMLTSLWHLNYFDIGCQNVPIIYCKYDIPYGFPPFFQAESYSQFVNHRFCDKSELIFVDLPVLQNLKTAKYNAISYSVLFFNIRLDIYKICFRNHLVNLDISNNQAQYIHGTLCCLQSLRYLNARNMRTMYIDPYFFHDMFSLEVLLLGGSFPANTFNNSKAVHLFDKNVKLEYLDLSENGFTFLPRKLFNNLTRLRTIDLSNNKLEQLDVELLNSLTKLQTINVSSNQLKQIPSQILNHMENLHLIENTSTKFIIDMRFNPFICECDSISNLKRVIASRGSINFIGHNSEELKCLIHHRQNVSFRQALQYLLKRCQNLDMASLIFLALLYPIALILIFLMSLAFKHRWNVIYAWHTFLQLFGKKNFAQDTEMFVFDAFISYSSRDEDWVRTVLVKQLESRKKPCRLCVDYRNFMPGEYIGNNIITAIKESRKVILVITKAYIKSGWCDFEMRAAQQQHLRKMRGGIIALVFPEVLKIIATCKLSAALDNLLKSVTYLEWQPEEPAQRLFWFRLEQALPSTN